ncbi:MAG: threonine--tRNA ligase, partial [Zetaproteobacteria bacterium]|nr:threonine--tRNA ligase [Pseudobdellovibrionaceae bacterium]
MELQDNPQLYKVRHSMAHVMAQAVQSLFPDTKLGFGPPTDAGFFYDFDFGDYTLTESDLKKIEKNMKKIISQKQNFVRSEFEKVDEALVKLSDHADEPYKKENLTNLSDR